MRGRLHALSFVRSMAHAGRAPGVFHPAAGLDPGQRSAGARRAGLARAVRPDRCRVAPRAQRGQALPHAAERPAGRSRDVPVLARCRTHPGRGRDRARRRHPDLPGRFPPLQGEIRRARAGGLDLLALDGATTYAVPFKPDWQVHIERAADGGMLYRGTSGLGGFEERWPDDTGVVSPWSIRMTGYPACSTCSSTASMDREPADRARDGRWP